MQWEHWKGRRNEDDQQQICHLCCCDFVLFDETAKNLKYISACYCATLSNTLQNFCIPAQSSWSDCMTDMTRLSQETPGSRDSDSRARVTMLSVPDIAMSPVASWIRDELTPPQSQHGHSALSTSVTMRIFRVYLVIAVIMGSAMMSIYDQLLGR